jgi:hypothetical protein
LPPPEDDIDPDGAINSTIVEDSDDEFELPVHPTPIVETSIIHTETTTTTEEPKKKRVVSKKKAEA